MTHPLLLELREQIETPRLLLRRYRPGDGEWYAQMSLKNKAHLARYEAGNPVMKINSADQAEVLIREFSNDWSARRAFFMGAFNKQDGAFAAQIYIGVVNWELPEFEIGYFADVDHTRQGLVTEAVKAAMDFVFTDLGAWRARLECDDGNVPSQRVAEKCGMTLEGHFRQNMRHADGSFTGTYFYGLLRSEYLHQEHQ